MSDTITLPRSVVEQALDALQDADTMMEHRQDVELRHSAMAALRAALEQQQGEQEPVGTLSIEVIGPRTKVDVEWNDPLYQLPSGNYKLYTRQQPKRERLPVGAELFIHPQNLRCKSNQARLATLWGYVKPQPKREPMPPQADTPLTQEQLTIFKYGWKCAESAHGIRGKA